MEIYVRLCYNNTMNKQRIRSIIILLGIILISGIFMIIYSNREQGGLVVITVDGQVYETLPVYVDTRFTVETDKGCNVVIIENGQVSVSDADCANQVCVNSRSISKNGEVIACIPHGLVITVTSPEQEVDAVAY